MGESVVWNLEASEYFHQHQTGDAGQSDSHKYALHYNNSNKDQANFYSEQRNDSFLSDSSVYIHEWLAHDLVNTVFNTNQENDSFFCFKSNCYSL